MINNKLICGVIILLFIFITCTTTSLLKSQNANLNTIIIPEVQPDQSDDHPIILQRQPSTETNRVEKDYLSEEVFIVESNSSVTSTMDSKDDKVS